MIAAKSAGWPSLPRWPARFHGRLRLGPAWVGAIAVAAAVLVLAPLVSLVVLAFADTGDLWAHLARYVIPVALIQTALLLAGVAAVTIVVGVGAAWVVTTFDFPGRTAFTWLLPLPLAIPTYIVAYVYADLLDALGPVQSAAARDLRLALRRRLLVPEHPLARRRDLRDRLRALPVRLSGRARDVPDARRAIRRGGARARRAGRWALALRITLPLARPAIAVGLALALLETLNDIGASEYFGVPTLTLSIFTTWLNRGSLAGAAQIACFMLAIVAALIALERYGRRRRVVRGADPSGRAPELGASDWKARARFLPPAACFVPVLLGFLLPAGYLVREVIGRGLLVGFDPSSYAIPPRPWRWRRPRPRSCW